MHSHPLQPLLKPSSIAVLGASPKSGSVGNEVLVNLRKGGFEGAIYAVNPGYDCIGDLPCFGRLNDIPTPPEHVIFAISDQRIEASLDEVIALGIPACTIFSSLLLVNDSSPSLKQRITAKATAAGLLVAGANGMGFYNVRDRVLAGGFDTRDHPFPGNVSLISQSGAGMSGIVDCEQRIQFNFAVSSGYELTVSMEDYLDYALDLPETRVVGLFLETSRYPDKLLSAFKKANDRDIPIVVLKVGRTELAARLAVSHSGALAGSDRAYDAVFRRFGVQRVADMDELATTLLMFSQTKPVADGGLVCLHDSGGERQLLVDLADRHGVPLTELSEQSEIALEKLLDPGLPAINPLDAWGAGGADASHKMADCFTHLLMDPAAALGAVVHDRGPNSQIYPSYLDYLHRAQLKTGKPVFLVANRQGSGSDGLAIDSTHRDLPVIDGVSQFLVGTRCLLAYRDFKKREAHEHGALDPDKVRDWHSRLREQTAVGELLATQFLADFGLPMVVGSPVSNPDELALAATKQRFPLVLKTAKSGVAHKSDVGGVVLDIPNREALQQAYSDMAERLGPEVLVSPMIKRSGKELLLGIISDEQFGPMVVVGFGGVYAELLDDAVVLMPPFTPQLVEQVLNRLHLAKLVQGYRGKPRINVHQYAEMAVLAGDIALAFKGVIAEVDINPMLVTEDSCLGLDALVVLKKIKVSTDIKREKQ